MKRLILAVLFGMLLTTPVVANEGKWPGVDEAVVEKYASQLGYEASDPYINTDQGDLLLFVFALAGGVGGFIMGYYWHKLFVVKQDLNSEV
jgi:ABC-type cobalt transport system substrate-binding protein